MEFRDELKLVDKEKWTRSECSMGLCGGLALVDKGPKGRVVEVVDVC